MGKKIEKALGKDKHSIQGSVDDADKPPEPYVCKGHFTDDFTELCKRSNMERIPSVVLRPKRPPSPNSAPPPEEKHKGSKKDTKRAQQEAQMLETEPEPEVDEFGDPLPKTFLIKNKFEYFKPCIQTEMDHPDKQDTVTSIFIRGWKLDMEMLKILKECWVKLEKLHTVNLWNSGLNGQTIETLASFLPDCINIRILILDNNPVKEQNFDMLLKEESNNKKPSNLQQLSLRHCSVNDKGAENLAKSLGALYKTNNKLVSLNLNGNFITDQGASSLARALRLNRCLLSLSLAYNQIGDQGATAFGNVISKFELTHEEIVERRKLQSEKSESPVDYRRSPMPNGRRGESRDRPGSVRSQINLDKGDKKKQGGSKGKKEKEKEDDKGKSKGKKDEKTKKASTASQGGRQSAASMVGDSKGKGKDKGKSKKGKGDAPDAETPDHQELVSPLLDESERLDGKILLVGNRNLINLNLSHNQITEIGLKELDNALAFQISHTILADKKLGNQGLMRLCVQKNNIPSDNEYLMKIRQKMISRDPFFKQQKSPDEESTGQRSASKVSDKSK